MKDAERPCALCWWFLFFFLVERKLRKLKRGKKLRPMLNKQRNVKIYTENTHNFFFFINIALLISLLSSLVIIWANKMCVFFVKNVKCDITRALCELWEMCKHSRLFQRGLMQFVWFCELLIEEICHFTIESMSKALQREWLNWNSRNAYDVIIFDDDFDLKSL